MPECQKNLARISISSGSQLLQSGIGILVFSVSPVPLVMDKSGIAQLCIKLRNKLTNCAYDLSSLMGAQAREYK